MMHARGAGRGSSLSSLPLLPAAAPCGPRGLLHRCQHPRSLKTAGTQTHPVRAYLPQHNPTGHSAQQAPGSLSSTEISGRAAAGRADERAGSSLITISSAIFPSTASLAAAVANTGSPSCSSSQLLSCSLLQEISPSGAGTAQPPAMLRRRWLGPASY
jgi:hypothetical protein